MLYAIGLSEKTGHAGKPAEGSRYLLHFGVCRIFNALYRFVYACHDNVGKRFHIVGIYYFGIDFY